MIVSTVTLHDVAKAAGVHYSTVSLALRGNARIASTTRENVQKVAARLGYTAHPAARALVERRNSKTLRGPVIAWIENHPPDVVQDSIGYRHLVLKGARRLAKTLGYSWQTFRIGTDGVPADDLDANLRQAEAECVIIGQFIPGHAELQLDWERYCIVRVDSQFLSTPVHCVSSDRILNVRRAFKEMWLSGHRRIGLCTSRLQEDCTRQRHAMGYLMEEKCLDAPERIPPLFYPYGTRPKELTKELSLWIAKHQPTVVLHDFDSRWLGPPPANHVRWINLCETHVRPGFGGIDPMAAKVGEKAVETVAMLLRTGERGIPRFAHDTYVEGRWSDA